MRSCRLVSAAVTICAAAAADVTNVPREQFDQWRDRLIPLPHEIAIPRKTTVSPNAVGIQVRPEAGEVEQQALLELTNLFEARAGTKPGGTAFTIRLALLDARGQLDGTMHPLADRLRALPHSAQAYAIEPKGNAGLLVVSLDPRGLYHGVQTLKQLLEPHIKPDITVIPLAHIVDWPDVDERGLWNFDLDLIPWIASLKLNFAKVPSGVKHIEKGKPVATWVASTKRFPNVLIEGRKRALKAVPIVSHLNYIGAKHGGYKAYPDMAGKGDEAIPTTWNKARRLRVPCGASPALKQIIIECLLELASKGATDVSVWLSEHQGQCQCETCRAAGQLRMETRAACDAWQEARKRYPELDIRIFYCMGGKDADDTYKVLAELPAEVKIERCYGQFGEAFDKIAAEGRWLASYAGPPLPKAEHSGLRFHGGSATSDYVNRLIGRQWDAVYSINYVYSTGAYQRGFYSFHVHALAEWTWNSKGRRLGELAKTWATRAGYAKPEKVAAWIELMDPVEKALHYVLRTRVWSQFPEAIAEKRAFRAGRDLLAGFPAGTTLSENMARCERAGVRAQEAEAPDLALESTYALALCRVVRAVNALLTGAPNQQQVDAILADLRQATAEMVRTFDTKIRLVEAEPTAFAASTKKTHTDLWEARIAGIAKALSRTD